MSRPTRPLSLWPLAAIALAAMPAPANAHRVVAGGASMSEPQVRDARCVKQTQSWVCRSGDLLRLRGKELDDVSGIVFLGQDGKADDRRARVRRHRASRLTVRVPRGALSGPLGLVDAQISAGRTPQTLQVIASPESPAQTAPGDDDTVGAIGAVWRFPIDGDYEVGTSATTGFGGGRGHQGQDIFTECGTPLVAVTDTRVQRVAFQSRAGNYVVLQDDSGASYAYMHLRDPAGLTKGQRLSAGERVGVAGQTGRATGCQLHFEKWTAPGWYEGGRPIDPAADLRRWEARRGRGDVAPLMS